MAQSVVEKSIRQTDRFTEKGNVKIDTVYKHEKKVVNKEGCKKETVRMQKEGKAQRERERHGGNWRRWSDLIQ